VSLRSKLLLALIPLAAALLLLGGQAIRVIAQQGELSQRILKDNYRSVLAAQRMKEAMERIDSAMAFRAAGRADKAQAQDAQNRARFAAELEVQEHNITEVGEAEATRELRARWQSYLSEAEQFVALPPADLSARYFAKMEPAFLRVKDAADRILELNQDAMVRKSEQVRIASEKQNAMMLAATLAAALSGVLASVWVTAQLLRPLSVLSQAVRRVAEGDLEARAVLLGGDEIAQLAGEFNTMAARLAEYRRSSLGELLQAQHASQAAIDSLPDPVVIFGNDGAVLNVNRAAESLLQIGSGAGAKGPSDPLSLASPPVRTLLERVRAHVISGKGAYAPKGFEEALRLDASDGAHYLLPRAEPVYSEDAGIVGAAIVLQDVTRLWRFDELKNDLVATVAHEFRTPLTSLRMAIHLCVEGAVGPITEKQSELLHGARQDCERLQDIVDDLLDLARIQAGRGEVAPQPIAARALVEKAIAALREPASGAGVKLVDALVDSSLELLADPERVGLVLSNLIGNALRHAPRGSAVELAAAKEGNEVRFTVRDHGAGVPREYQQRIFEKFFRVPGTTGEGVGLGLYISREIVRAHGGEMGVEAAPGGGALFWFTLPLAPPAARA